jgi:CRISPR-associated protein Csd1
MSILASLVRAYDRLPDAPSFGYSVEKIGFLISLNDDGSVAHVVDLRNGEGKNKQPKMMLVPQAVKRASGIAPNFLWDKTAYVLGVTAGEGKRTADEHAAFRTRHIEALADTNDVGLKALFFFIHNWTADQFTGEVWSEEMKGQNLVFALESERMQGICIHDRPAAKDLWSSVSGADVRSPQICLVTGKSAPIARLHSSIKGVWGAQSSGASIVSFNLDAFTSYGHEQGDNAPVSEAAAFAYTTTLNRFLERDSGHRIQIGDASTVFWADATDKEAAEAAEAFFGEMITPTANDADATKSVREKLERLRKGEQLAEVEPKLAEGVRFYVLGLAPNAARISIRFYFEDDFGVLTTNYRKYVGDMAFEPWPHGRPRPTIANCVLRTAPARQDRNEKITFDKDQQSPLLAGELLRAILTGNRFPGALLAHLLMRIRSDQVLDSIRVSLIKGLLVREMRIEGRLPKRPDGTPKEDYLVRSDPDDPNPARRLGRLFAVIERAQLAALGDEINATVKDKFLGAAAATPQQVFVGILKNSQNHTKRLRNGHSDARWIKDAAHAKRVGAALERDIGRLWGTFENGVPAQHSSEEQGLFLVGYYQERFGGKSDATDEPEFGPDSTIEGEE